MLRFGSSAVLALLLAMLAPNVAHAICPAGFLEVGSGASPLGCIQQTEHANGTLFPNYFTATEICFDQYGGRLPTFQELLIASENVALVDPNPDEAEWVADLIDPSTNSGAGFAFMDSPDPRGPFPLAQAGAANVRCWIPAQAVVAASVPSLGGWLEIALAGSLLLAAARSMPRS